MTAAEKLRRLRELWLLLRDWLRDATNAYPGSRDEAAAEVMRRIDQLLGEPEDG